MSSELYNQRQASVLAKKRSYGDNDNCSGIICGLNEADIALSCTEPTSIQYIGMTVTSAQTTSRMDATTSSIFFCVDFMDFIHPRMLNATCSNRTCSKRSVFSTEKMG
ncbi:hypothetical protein [Paenibacillus sp. UASWS1643]|uniref:hypothetical protein n=1 Tax=Paenibacillus sp. UASWS1643 TaxID=2580422 RepID=UPI00398BFE9B